MIEYRSRPHPCWCTGYWFPHRKGGGACEHSTSRPYHLAVRHGAPPDELFDAFIEAIWHSRERGSKSAVCPF